MQEEVVILVDRDDNEVGLAPKLAVHREGKLHRAVSVFILNDVGEMLLQRRAEAKYHSGGLWSNACCSHPRPGESPERTAVRRLEEEMGLSCGLEYVFNFIYQASLPGGLIEHELDHVFAGRVGGDPAPNALEVEDWRWAPIEQVERELAEDPGRFTAWFPIAFRHLMDRAANV